MSNPLEYATPAPNRRHSVWAIIGFAVAVLMSVGAGLALWALVHAMMSGTTGGTTYGVSPLYYAIGGIAAGLCAVGVWRGGKKWIGLIGFGLAVVSSAVMYVLVARSPW